MIGRNRHVTSPIWSRIDWLASPKMRIVSAGFAELKRDKTVHLKINLPLSGRSKHQLWSAEMLVFSDLSYTLRLKQSVPAPHLTYLSIGRSENKSMM